MTPLFDQVKFFHILRGNNKEADKQANLACQMNEERNKVNGIVGLVIIP